MFLYLVVRILVTQYFHTVGYNEFLAVFLFDWLLMVVILSIINSYWACLLLRLKVFLYALLYSINQCLLCLLTEILAPINISANALLGRFRKLNLWLWTDMLEFIEVSISLYLLDVSMKHSFFPGLPYKEFIIFPGGCRQYRVLEVYSFIGCLQGVYQKPLLYPYVNMVWFFCILGQVQMGLAVSSPSFPLPLIFPSQVLKK